MKKMMVMTLSEILRKLFRLAVEFRILPLNLGYCNTDACVEIIASGYCSNLSRNIILTATKFTIII